VDVSIGFTLTGALAQFSRSGLVQDVAGRLIAMFVRNLEAKLSGNTVAIQGEAPGLDAASLVFDVLKARLKRLFGRLFGSR
jgi:carbon-monoxide dehydrogenase small subunit